MGRRAPDGLAGLALAAAVLLSACAPARSPTPPRAIATEPPAPQPATSPRARRLADFDALWTFVRDRYPFFPDKATDWDRVRAIHRPRAADARDAEAFLHVLEATLDELYDPHCMLNTNTDDSWRPVPHDVFVEEHDDAVVVTGIRGGSAAAEAGVRVGDEVVAIGGVPVHEAARARMPAALTHDDPAARQWALLSAVAGRHGDIRRFELRRDGASLEVVLPKDPPSSSPRHVQSRVLPGDIGYLRIPTFADEAAVADVDAALEGLRPTKALLIDVRDDPGGDTAIARPIMGRFVTETTPYARMARREGAGLGPRWTEVVDPRGPWTYAKPVVILVDRFSVSMAEGFAMGMQGMGRARIVGTKMAGLGAAIGRITLPRSGIGAQISTEPVYHVDGTPRWKMVPDVEVDLLQRSATHGDPILDAGRREASRLEGSAPEHE